MNAEPNSPAFQRKPDPSEPWRYVCPECRAQVHTTHSQNNRYQCNGCNRAFDPGDLLDLKREGR